ncbi:hypothetical protein JHK87_033467 [Glycine soja]|nr:hypothetical protein JHK87_033467 [Glycine soja]
MFLLSKKDAEEIPIPCTSDGGASGGEASNTRSENRVQTNRQQAQEGGRLPPQVPKFHHQHCPGQANHRLTTRVQRRIYSHATDVAIRPLNEEKAVQAAADLLGELFVFSVGFKSKGLLRVRVAGAAIIFEVQRSSRSEARKEELRTQEIEEIKTKNEELAREIALLAQKLEELEQLSRGRGLLGTLNIKHSRVSQDRKSN